MSDIDLRLLRVFKSVVDCGGMSAAELDLNIGISTVSRHIKDLEQRLSLVLCRRGRAGFATTDEGHRVYEETVRLLSAIDAFRAGIDDIHCTLGGALHVAVFDKTATNPNSAIWKAVSLFVDRAPEVAIHLHVGSIQAIERGVLDGAFHVGVIPTHRRSKALSYTQLFEESMFMYCGASHPLFPVPPSAISWAKVRRHEFAGLGYHSPNMEVSRGARLLRSATGFDQESIATLILSGRFLGFLPDHYAEVFERKGQMRAINRALFRYACEFVSVVRRSPQPPRSATAFVECLRQSHSR